MEAITNAVNGARNALPASGGMTQSVGGIAFLIVGIIVLYYVYKFLFDGMIVENQAVVTSAIPANPTSAPTPSTILPVYEGGEYTITFWIYVTAYKDQVGKNKHILELSPNTTTGTPTSTLAVGLGSFTNKLMVRVNTNAAGTEQLTATNLTAMFQPTQVTPGQLLQDTMPLCDLPEIELQRWVCIGVVLNGRTVDVYLDGKLARSCVLPSFFTVDANGVKMKLLQYGGFSGFLSNVYVHSAALNPDQLYRIYMAGPSDATDRGFLSWIGGIFDVKGQVTYSYPKPGMTYPRETVTF